MTLNERKINKGIAMNKMNQISSNESLFLVLK